MQIALKATPDGSGFHPGQLWGAVPALADRTSVGSDQQRSLRSALDRAALVIREQEKRIRDLETLSLTDELTGLTNRRGFLRAFERELALTCRDAQQGGVLIMVDLDAFKQINDRWGHGAGDIYLRKAATVLRDSVRATDIVARLGGDEFALLLTAIAPGDAMARVRRLEDAFAGHSASLAEQVPLRGSFGAAIYDGAHDAETVMRVADTRLYAHKARHKNVIAARAG